MNSCVANSGTNIGGVCAMNYNKKPPYHKRLQVLLSDPSIKTAGSSASCSRSIYVITGNHSWHKAREIENSHSFLLLPPSDDPFQYDWSILAGHDPIIVIVEGEASTDQLFALASALDRYGVNRILYPKGDGSAIRYISQRVIDHE